MVVSHACITPINQSFYADVAKATGWDVSLVIPSSWSNAYSAEAEVSRWRSFEGALHAIPVWKAGNIPLHLYKKNMITFLRKHRPDVIYVHHEPYGLATAQVCLANRLTGKRPMGFYAAQNIAKTYPIPFRWLEKFVLQQSTFAFPVTEGALEVLREKGYTGVAEVLPLAVDAAVYHPDEELAADWRRRLGIAEGEFVVGYLGRLVEEKGLATLLRALQQLPNLNWRCVIAGSGPFEATLKTMVSEFGMEGRVLFPGFVPHTSAPGLMAAFDLLAIPSETRPNWREQFGRVIVEANACGTAVIGTDSGEIANVLRKTGGGICVPEKDPQALANGILALARDPERVRQLALKGAFEVRRQFDQGYLVSRFVKVVEAGTHAKANH